MALGVATAHLHQTDHQTQQQVLQRLVSAMAQSGDGAVQGAAAEGLGMLCSHLLQAGAVSARQVSTASCWAAGHTFTLRVPQQGHKPSQNTPGLPCCQSPLRRDCAPPIAGDQLLWQAKG